MVIELIRKWSYDYIKMECANDKCYGVLAVGLSGVRVPRFGLTGPQGPSHMLCAYTFAYHSQSIAHRR